MVDLAVYCNGIATGGAMLLEPEQEELLAKFVEAHRSAPKERRGSFLVSEAFGRPAEFHSAGRGRSSPVADPTPTSWRLTAF
jgi:hypothetical protein